MTEHCVRPEFRVEHRPGRRGHLETRSFVSKSQVLVGSRLRHGCCCSRGNQKEATHQGSLVSFVDSLLGYAKYKSKGA